MILPKRPPLTNPIPNADIPNAPEQYIVKAPYWDAVVSGNLVVSEDGTLTLPPETEGGDSNTEVLSAYWSMPLGEGLTVNEQGFLVPYVPPYIYCTPAYPSLPPSDPPYGCETEVNTAGVTDFTDAWNGCNLTDPLPCIDTSSGQYFYQAFRNNNWETFPTLDFSSGTYFGFTWADNVNLTEFPFVNVSNGENFEGAWYNCTSLTTFPLLDFSNATVLGDGENLNYGAWENCESLVSFPAIDTSNVEKFTYAWDDCYSLESFPLIDTSSGVIFDYAWSHCTSLTSFPLLDVSSGTNFDLAWYNCTSLTSFPLLDISSGTNFSGSWGNCTSLTSFPTLDVSSGTDFNSAWYNCSNLTSFPTLDVSSGTDFNSAWQNCYNLTTFPALDFSSGIYFNSTWQNCTSLATFPAGVFNNCLATNFSNSWFNCALSQTSVDNILVSLDTAGQSNGTVSINGGTSSAPGVAGLAAKASLVAKGWSIYTN